MEIGIFWLKFLKCILNGPNNNKSANIGSDNGLAPNRDWFS